MDTDTFDTLPFNVRISTGGLHIYNSAQIVCQALTVCLFPSMFASLKTRPTRRSCSVTKKLMAWSLSLAPMSVGFSVFSGLTTIWFPWGVCDVGSLYFVAAGTSSSLVFRIRDDSPPSQSEFFLCLNFSRCGIPLKRANNDS